MTLGDWATTSIAAEGTHHLQDGNPLYSPRFLEVLKFHPPGLAAVRDATGAFHIDAAGRAAYRARFQRTFGFYGGLAAVEEETGWSHVLPDGSPLYPERYAWCGNFGASRCPVRAQDGAYFHLTAAGVPAYPERYRYAGDYRDGFAVVQRGDGLHTHVDLHGRPLHGVWFIELDVFHKGFARARDERGFHHVDLHARPLYARRFAAVEPFYNGQARVEGGDGSLEVIDESGATRQRLRLPRRSALSALSADMVGFWRTQTIRAAVGAALFDFLPGTIEELSVRTEIPLDAMARLLRALRELELVEPRSAGAWGPTERGRLLRAVGAPSGVAAAAKLWSGDHYRRWEHLAEALRRTDVDPAPSSYFDGLSGAALDDYHAAMGAYAADDYGALSSALDWSAHRRVVDVGGGRGALLFPLLEAQGHLQGVLLDRPAVVAGASPPPSLRGRVEILAADFFAPWSVKADALILSRVLHDWPDQDARRILERAREALVEGGRVYVIEMVLSELEPGGGLLDLNMLVMTGGRERTFSAWQQLFAECGLSLREQLPLSAVCSILVGAPR